MQPPQVIGNKAYFVVGRHQGLQLVGWAGKEMASFVSQFLAIIKLLLTKLTIVLGINLIQRVLHPQGERTHIAHCQQRLLCVTPFCSHIIMSTNFCLFLWPTQASESIRKEYDHKCDQLRHQFAKDLSPQTIDRTRAVVKDLHSRIRVALHAVDSISKRIEKMRDEELFPQIIELIQG